MYTWDPMETVMNADLLRQGLVMKTETFLYYEINW